MNNKTFLTYLLIVIATYFIYEFIYFLFIEHILDMIYDNYYFKFIFCLIFAFLLNPLLTFITTDFIKLNITGLKTTTLEDRFKKDIDISNLD